MLRGRHNDDRFIDLQPVFEEAGHRFVRNVSSW